MLDDLNNYPQHVNFSSEVAIIGSGPAGLVLAKKLLIKGIKVMLISSGNDLFNRRNQELYKGINFDNLPTIPMSASRLRMFGGTSNHWTGHCGPFDEVDFNSRPFITDSGWPIKKEDLNSYYFEAHKILELGSYEYSTSNKYMESFSDYNKLKNLKLSFLNQNPYRFGPEWRDFFTAEKNCTVLENSNLTDIKFTKDLKHVTSLKVKSLNGNSATIKCKSAVLACGGIENARLLLNSPLSKTLPCLGKYYAFHPRIVGAELHLASPVTKENIFQWHDDRGSKKKAFITNTNAYQLNTMQPNYAMALLNHWEPYSDGFRAALRLKKGLETKTYTGSVKDDLLTVIGSFGTVAREYKRHRNVDLIHSFDLMTYIDPLPVKDNLIKLNNERDELGMRRCTAIWKPTDRDIKFTREFNMNIAQHFGEMGLGRVKINPAIFDKDGFNELIKKSSGGGHQMGTTRMSESSKSGVVDSNLIVHGTSNLFCAGSSIFPTYSWVNPTMTIVAFSSRLADYLSSSIYQSNKEA